MELTKNVALTKQEHLSAAVFFFYSCYEKIHFAFQASSIHFCNWAVNFQGIFSSLVPPPRSWCIHFWVQTNKQGSRPPISSQRLFLLQRWKLVPPRRRVMGTSVSQLPVNHSSISCNVTSLPSVRCHGNEKWKKPVCCNSRRKHKEGGLKPKVSSGNSSSHCQLTC